MQLLLSCLSFFVFDCAVAVLSALWASMGQVVGRRSAGRSKETGWPSYFDAMEAHEGGEGFSCRSLKMDPQQGARAGRRNNGEAGSNLA